MHTRSLTSDSAQATENFGERLGAHLKGGEVIELISDLGGGKTTLVRGLARGMGSSDRVASPTFTVSKVYKAGALELHHFDFYRLQEGGMVAHELADFMHDPNIVTVVEWADVVHDVLPKARICIRLQHTGDEQRQITLEYPDSLAYIAKGIEA